jgi:hypothetical protein
LHRLSRTIAFRQGAKIAALAFVLNGHFTAQLPPIGGGYMGGERLDPSTHR